MSKDNQYFKITGTSNIGCNRKSQLHLYKVLLQLQLDYGVTLYKLSNKLILSLLDLIELADLRLRTGFLTSPRLSICVDPGIPLLSILLSINLLIYKSNCFLLSSPQSLTKESATPISLTHTSFHNSSIQTTHTVQLTIEHIFTFPATQTQRSQLLIPSSHS